MPIPLAPTGGGGGGVEIDPSELTCEIRWESPVLDDAGQQTDWQDEGDDWAKIEPFAGQEFFLIMQAKSLVTHRITTYWREGVKPDWRIVFEERIFHIDRVIDVLEQKVKLEIIAKENTQPTIE